MGYSDSWVPLAIASVILILPFDEQGFSDRKPEPDAGHRTYDKDRNYDEECPDGSSGCGQYCDRRDSNQDPNPQSGHDRACAKSGIHQSFTPMSRPQIHMSHHTRKSTNGTMKIAAMNVPNARRSCVMWLAALMIAAE